MLKEIEDRTVDSYIEEHTKGCTDFEVTGPFEDGSKHLWALDSGKIYLHILTPHGEGQCELRFLTEESAPAATDCPIRLLDQASQTDDEWVNAWRKQVRDAHRVAH